MGREDNRVVIVGGGVAGLFTALHVKNHEVIIVEASKRIGWPPHCSGIVSTNTYREFKEKVDVVVESIYDKAVFLDGKLNPICTIKSEKGPLAVKIARPHLEEELAVVVENNGHKILLGSRVKEIDGKEGKCVITGGGKHLCGRHVVVATGWNPPFASIFSKYCEKILGVEVHVELNKRLEPNGFITIHSNKIAPDFFGWIAPIYDGRRAAIGIADKDNAMHRLSHLVKIVDKKIGVRRILSRRGGVIVRGPPSKNIVVRRIAGIGDILCASKPFTGGGLYAITKLASSVAKYVEDKGEEELVEVWENLRRELLAQYYYTKFAILLKDLFLLLLFITCREGEKGTCEIDYDNHTSLIKCLLGSINDKK